MTAPSPMTDDGALSLRTSVGRDADAVLARRLPKAEVTHLSPRAGHGRTAAEHATPDRPGAAVPGTAGSRASPARHSHRWHGRRGERTPCAHRGRQPGPATGKEDPG